MTTKDISISHQHLFIYSDIKYRVHWRLFCKAQGTSFICWMPDRSSRRRFEENNEVSTRLCREHPKGWILQKPQVRTTSKRMQHNVEHFLSSELGHSPKRNVKLLGREQRSDFHHNRTTLSRHAGFSLVPSVSVLRLKVSIYRKQSFQSEWQCVKSFTNYVCVSS